MKQRKIDIDKVIREIEELKGNNCIKERLFNQVIQIIKDNIIKDNKMTFNEFLKKYFPKEHKKKQKEIDNENNKYK